MAEKKKIQSASENTVSAIQNAKPVGNATGYRVGAIILWVLALACEVLAILLAGGKLRITFMSTLVGIIILIVLDLVFLIIGSQLWKKANHISPASKKNPTKYWLWNNLGLIMAVFCFLPLIILLLTNKDLDKKTKTIATIAAVVALLIGGVAGYEFNDLSKEDKDAAITALEGTAVYWTPYGRVYHTHVIDEELSHTTDDGKDCPYLNRSDSLTRGTVEQALEAGKTKLCSYCQRHDHIEGEGLRTDDVPEPEGTTP